MFYWHLIGQWVYELLMSDQHLISLHSITTGSNTQVRRIKEMITSMTCLDFKRKSPNKYNKKYMENSEKNIDVDTGV